MYLLFYVKIMQSSFMMYFYDSTMYYTFSLSSNTEWQKIGQKNESWFIAPKPYFSISRKINLTFFKSSLEKSLLPKFNEDWSRTFYVKKLESFQTRVFWIRCLIFSPKLFAFSLLVKSVKANLTRKQKMFSHFE